MTGERAKSGALAKHLKQYFPQEFLHVVTSPTSRALEHKPKGGQMRFVGGQMVADKGGKWKHKSMQSAAKEFELPVGTTLLLFFPEIFDRATLKLDPRFQYEYKGANGKTYVGVKTPCPFCHSNKHVHFQQKTGYQSGRHRSIAVFRGNRIPIYSFRLTCTSTSCSGDPNGARKSGDSSDLVGQSTVVAYSDKVFPMYPDAIKRRYSEYLFTEAEDGAGGAILFNRALAYEVLKDETNFSELLRHMNEAFDRCLLAAIGAYVDFTKTQSNDSSCPWPDFDVESYRKAFAPPSSVNTIIKIFHQSFALIFPALKRDLFSRLPGNSVKMDGTFRFLKKTMNDKQSSEETKCLHVIWDQYGYVLSWAFAGPENDECFQRMMYHLRLRCERVGKEHVNAVKAAFSDTCCQGLQDVTDHWITYIWPECKRAPYRDLFHAIKRVSDATQPHHELGEPFNKLLSASILEWDETSKKHVANLFIKKERRKLVPELAREEVVKRPLYKKKVKNYTPSKDSMEAALREAYTNIEKEDLRLKTEATLNGGGYLPFLKKGELGLEQRERWRTCWPM